MYMHPTVMKGFPPAPETRLGPGNWFQLPYLRWSMLHRSLQVATANVWRGDAPPSPLTFAPQALDDVPVTGLDGRPTALLAHLQALEADGFLVMHCGRVVYERYFHGMRVHDQHSSASVSKSFLSLVVGNLAAQGVLDLGRTAEHYVPEMQGSAMGGATLQQLLDMSAGIVRPTMDGRPGELGTQDGGVFEVIGLMPRKPDSPQDFYDFILRKPAQGGHGQAFYYDNGQPEAVAWVLRRVTGRTIADLMSELVWAPLAPDRDAYYSIDRTGAEFTAGGLGLTLRDLARAGEMLRCEGHYNGRQIVPAAYLADIRAGGDRGHFARSRFVSALPQGSYRGLFWHTHDDVGGFLAWGRFGQRLYVSPRAELVIAQFSSAPGGVPHPFDIPLVRLQHELAHHFL